MTSRSQIYLFAFGLISVGLGLTLYKNLALHFPLFPGDVRTVWNVEAKITFKPYTNAPITADLALPDVQNGYEILDETFGSSGYRFNIEEENEQRRAVWTQPNASGEQTLYYKVQVTESGTGITAPSPDFPIDITKPDWTQAEATAALSIIQRVRDVSSAPQEFAAALLTTLNGDQVNQDVRLLLASNAKKSIADIALKLLAEADIPAHMIRGVRLRNRQYNDPPTELIEVYDGSSWMIFDPENAQPGLPPNFFMWQRGGYSLLDLEGGRNSRIRFSILSNVIPSKNIALKLAKAETVALVDFNIYSLPIEKQNIFKSLLLVPIGALVVVIFRVLIGLKTSGTFMPVLIALAFIQTTLLAGIGILVTLVLVGLWLRSYLSRLDLLMVSRIGAVLIMVVFLMAGFSVMSYKLGLDQVLNITFFPMIIMAWTIERMSITWEEDGPREVAKQGSGSLLVAVIAYLSMTNRMVEHLTYNFPELLLVVLGIILMLGQYSGYRLSELRRFRHMHD